MDAQDTQKCLGTEHPQLHRRVSSQCSRSPSPELPSSPASPVPCTPPQTIVLSLWPSAARSQISFYAEGYQTLYPNAQIILLHYSASRTGNAPLETVLDTLVQKNEKQQLFPSDPSILLHVFGDDGAAQACRLLRYFRARTGSALSVRAMVNDAAPALASPSISTSIKSPRLLVTSIYTRIIAFLLSLLAMLTFWRSNAESYQVQQDLQDPLLVPHDVRRCYVFAEKDVIFSWTTPNADNDEAERTEYPCKRTSIDKGGKWDGNKERYWLGIEGAWDGQA